MKTLSGKNQDLSHGKTCLQVLHEIIENAKTFRIFAVLDVHQ